MTDLNLTMVQNVECPVEQVAWVLKALIAMETRGRWGASLVETKER